MSLHFQAAALVDVPSYPNAIAWSNENLVAVASGHIVTILNPATPTGSRGLITIPVNEPFPIGTIERKDLLAGCLLPTSLTRNIDLTRKIGPLVRSISWSPVGLAPNSGCLLAVCTTQGHVKLYRLPFCEYSVECIEITDISEMLYTYLAIEGFEKSTTSFPVASEENQNQARENQYPDDDVPIPVMAKSKRRRKNASTDIYESNDLGRSIPPVVPPSNSKSRAVKKVQDNEVPLISAEQYASRNAMLSSLIVAWSPIVHVSAEVGGSVIKSSSDCSILAVGAISGKITFWRVDRPRRYSITNNMESTDVSLIGIMQAHSSWVTAISFSMSDPDASKPQLILATGSTDGSVKIWQACAVELLESSEICQAPFLLLKEITPVNYAPVSALGLTMTKKKPQIFLLAIGKGSGAVEAWSCDISTRKFDEAGSYDAHDHVVTGLAWGFNGNCLYTCSQDNSLRSWTLHGNVLCEASIPSNTPNVKISTDVPNLFRSCYGVALSPGNLVIAVVRTFDTERLNPMYQKRTLKGCVEFLWVGGQQLDNSIDSCADSDIQVFPGFPERELINWERNIFWSFNHHQYLDEPLVVWDVILALLAFKQSVPKYVKHILMKWLGTSRRESPCRSTSLLTEVSESVAKLPSRLLNLINIISRHVVLEKGKAYNFNVERSDAEAMFDTEELSLWEELIDNCENELRLRLVGSSFSAALSLLSGSSTKNHGRRFWIPAGIAQMEQWVARNKGPVNDNVKVLGGDIKKVKKSRRQSMLEYVLEEKCSLCSALVPFESAEEALCQGAETNETGEKIRHKLHRCAVSMRICPATPMWYCMSCQRRALNLAPKPFFSMHKYPSDFKFFTEILSSEEGTMKPFCPFCGILLQRFLPEFLLSASPA